MNKNDLEDASDRWVSAARINGYRCTRCGEIPPYEERETYFESKMCGWCLHQSRKDD